MEILGVGIDIIENDRIKKVLEQWPHQFREKVFLPEEIAYCDEKKDSYRNYSARFACKEAVFKAFGSAGNKQNVGWLDVEVVRDSEGKPGIRFLGKGKSLAAELGIKDVFIAMSHSDNYSVAQVIFAK